MDKFRKLAYLIVVVIITVVICGKVYTVSEASIHVSTEPYEIEFSTEPYDQGFSKEMNISSYKATLETSRYIYHAGGGTETGNTYVNSIDVLDSYYNNGCRLFEIDVNITKDDRLVLVHGWKKHDYNKRIGIEYYNENELNENNEYIPTFDEFMKFKIQDDYNAYSFEQLVSYMKSHEDMYVMLDAGIRSYMDTKKYYELVVKEAKDDEILHRFIVGGHTKDMLRAVKEVYDFSLINLAYNEEEFGTVEDFFRYCEQEEVVSYGFPTGRDTSDIEDFTSKSDMYSYVFTINEEDEAMNLFDKGVSIVGTDFLY